MSPVRPDEMRRGYALRRLRPRPWPRAGALRALLAALVLVPLAATTADAHTRSQSYSAWTRDGRELRVSFTAPALQATRLPQVEGHELSSLDALLARHLERTLRVSVGGADCRRTAGFRPLRAREGFVRAEARWTCPDAAGLRVRNDAFFEVSAAHVHFARVLGDDARAAEFLFSDAERVHEFGATAREDGASGSATFTRYLRLGAEHILIGYDHLAFLLALLLLPGRLGELARIVTGFTIGHSLTLSLAALELARPDAALIEALIGFTVAIVAAENLLLRARGRRSVSLWAGASLAALALLAIAVGRGPAPATLAGLALFTPCYLELAREPESARRIRPSISLAFGLVHGFGFAGVLAELGLPTSRLLPALFGFNLGVELGQLAVVAALWLLGAGLLARTRWIDRGLVSDVASSLLLALGLYWFLSRAYA